MRENDNPPGTAVHQGRWMSEEYEPGLVSVIVPTYNRAHYLGETMDSVIAQSYRPIELIVVDDGSTDNTQQVVTDLRKGCSVDSDFHFRYLRQEHQGAQVARNLGLKECKGEYVQFLDSDDILEEDKLSCQVAYLSTHSSCDVVYGDWTEGTDRKAALPMSLRPHPDMVVALLCIGWVASFAYLYRRIFAQNTMWDPSVRVNQDFDFNIRMAAQGARFAHLSGQAGWYRTHSCPRVSSVTAISRARQTIQILGRIEKILVDGNALTPERAWALAHRYLVIGRQAYDTAPEVLTEVCQHIDRICPGFQPRNVAYRMVTRVLGYKRTQFLWSLARRMRVV